MDATKRKPLRRGKPLKRSGIKRKRRRPRDRDRWNTTEWKLHCDTLWSRAVRLGGTCEVCGATDKRLEAHHLIPRSCLYFRHHLENGVCLCTTCHTFGWMMSAHGAPLDFINWMQANKPEQFAWWTEHKNEIHSNPTIADYRDIAAHLEAVIEKQEKYEFCQDTIRECSE